MHRHLALLTLTAATAILWLPGCKSSAPPSRPLPAATRFDTNKLVQLDVAIAQAIEESRLPGAVLWLEREGAVYRKAFGNRALEPVVEPMTEDTIFDAASLTKVIATTPAIMLLWQRGLIDLDAPVQRYIEEFRRHGKDGITVRQLMTHTSGLRAGISRPDGPMAAIQLACQEKVTNAPGTFFRYSDINYILLGEMVRRVSGKPLEHFVRAEIFWPLEMNDTGYFPALPKPKVLARIAPTQREGSNVLRGVVHDPTARRMDRVAGHAGLFTTAADLARFARMMLNEGKLDGVRIFAPVTVRLMTTVQSPPALSAKRGLGWDIDSPYSRPRGDLFPIGSYGHTGFTGTCLWIDPHSRTFWILMSNRVHPDGKGNILPLQKTLATLAADSVLGYDFAAPRNMTNEVSRLEIAR